MTCAVRLGLTRGSHAKTRIDLAAPHNRVKLARRPSVESHGDGWRWPVPDRTTLETGQFGCNRRTDRETLRCDRRNAACRSLCDFHLTAAALSTRVRRVCDGR